VWVNKLSTNDAWCEPDQRKTMWRPVGRSVRRLAGRRVTVSKHRWRVTPGVVTISSRRPDQTFRPKTEEKINALPRPHTHRPLLTLTLRHRLIRQCLLKRNSNALSPSSRACPRKGTINHLKMNSSTYVSDIPSPGRNNGTRLNNLPIYQFYKYYKQGKLAPRCSSQGGMVPYHETNTNERGATTDIPRSIRYDTELGPRFRGWGFLGKPVPLLGPP